MYIDRADSRCRLARHKPRAEFSKQCSLHSFNLPIKVHDFVFKGERGLTIILEAEKFYFATSVSALFLLKPALYTEF